MTQDKQLATADDWFARGNTCAERGEFGEALACYEKVRLERPADAGIYNNLGSTLARMERLPEALERYRQAQALDPNNADIHHNIGWILEQMHQLEEAVSAIGGRRNWARWSTVRTTTWRTVCNLWVVSTRRMRPIAVRSRSRRTAWCTTAISFSRSA